VVKLIAVELDSTEIHCPTFHKAQLHVAREEFFNIAMLMEYFNQQVYLVEHSVIIKLAVVELQLLDLL